jgi:hypothetical protein
MRLIPVFLLAFLPFLNAQIESLPLLTGRVSDETGEALIGATIKVFQDDKIIRGTITDYDGRFKINLAPGIYDVECSYTGYSTKKWTGVSIEQTEIRQMAFVMDKPMVIEIESVYYDFYPPLIDMMPGNTGNMFSSYQIRHMY